MSIATSAATVPRAPSKASISGWIVSPAFDLLFLANLPWLLALVPGFVAAEGTPHIAFWQLYFLTTPHRWMTLFLVALDPDRREGRPRRFLVLALLGLVTIAGVKLTTGAFVCLLLVDYVWNGWHFASQHFGVLRIYSRKAGGGWPRLERYGLRLFIFYVIARTAGWSTGWLEDSPDGLALLRGLDLAVLALPVCLLGFELFDRKGSRPLFGKRIYLASVCGLYAALLLALRDGQTVLVAALTTASSLFHAVEYLALVTYYAWRRRTDGSEGLFRTLAERWLLVLLSYVVLFGLSALVLQRLGTEVWQGLNLWAAFLHYAYDGMIWKLRRPETARVLGAVSTATSP
jgi:hypothetical protein